MLFVSWFICVICTLFVICDFVVFCLCVPVFILCMFCSENGVFFVYCMDIVMIILNTGVLFVSGIFCNVCMCMFTIRCFCLSMIYLWLSVFLGCVFLCNQFYEFNILWCTLSVTSFGSGFLLIEMCHFLHVFVGVVFLGIWFSRNWILYSSNIGVVILYLSCFYWHFVDCVWFFLCRVVYLDIFFCVVFLV